MTKIVGCTSTPSSKAMFDDAVAAMLAPYPPPPEALEGIEKLIGRLLAEAKPQAVWGNAARCIAESLSRCVLARPALPPTPSDIGTELIYVATDDLPIVAAALASALGVPGGTSMETGRRMVAVAEQVKAEAATKRQAMVTTLRAASP